ncbi:phosphatidylinositol phosphate phosphatase [Boletus coccyginus]|nr:phosphatidylinositol phosphate phosphatase [Boletus coccyginus]
MFLLHYLSYVAAVAAFVFVTLSLASGLLYISELIEEHSRPAKLIGQRAIYTIITLHALLYVTDSLPLLQTTFSIICHIVYLQNFSSHWPLISLTSASFISSCALAVTNHFLWFTHFSHLARDARLGYRHRGSVSSAPGFTDIATFFGICVWLVPLFLFLSLSANDNALPTSSGVVDPSSPSSLPARAQRSKSSLFKSMFSVFSKDRILASDKSIGLITPPSSASAPTYPLPSPSASSLHTPFLSPPPRSPKTSSHISQPEGNPHKALIFRAAEADASQVVVEFLPGDETNLTGAVRLTHRNVQGCLGLISVENDIFLAVIITATEVGNTRPSQSLPEKVARIHEVQFYCLTSSLWDDFSSSQDSLVNPENMDTMPSRDAYLQTLNSSAVFEHPCVPLTKILSSGSFYYALEPQWDLSTRVAVRLSRDSSIQNDIGVFDERFVWNEYIIRSLLDFREKLDPQERQDLDRCQFIVLAIQGYVGVSTMALPAPPVNGAPVIATLSLISRLGWKRAGTRFNTRGVDDDGNTANFVEFEEVFLVCYLSIYFRFISLSSTVFWEQQGIQTFGQRIQITRPQASQPAFERHFAHLIEEYGATHAINLLGAKENETTLTAAYAKHLYQARGIWGDHLSITHYDFHNAVRIAGHDSIVRELGHLEDITDHMDRFGFTLTDASTDERITEQHGVFRTNCLDCLDRTNFVQDILSRKAIEQFLGLVHREWLQANALWAHHRELWAENGDALSRIYAGTGALNTSFTRTGKRTLAGVISDATKSVSRAYINNFQDKSKQIAIDMFLGNLSNQAQVNIFDPVHDLVRKALDERISEYSSTCRCSIFVGTWNVNGRPPSESLIPWLFPRDSLTDIKFHRPDIFVLGFQEIVLLTAQQIVQTDPEKRRVWEHRIMETINGQSKTPGEYVLLRSEQLVGTALFVIVKSELTSVIRNVEGATRKTGLRGISGNKGGVGVRLDYHDTSFCFVTAHLAAGHSNVEERNADFWTITKGLHFLKGKTIASHDNIIWLADTNYRIGLPNESVRSLAMERDYDPLVGSDQLRIVVETGEAFAGYDEGPLLFPPTYKYDVGTDNYDSSEKMRIPAWTDRILFQGGLDLSVYSRAELRGSDHRPVFALFRTEVRIIDTVKRATLSRLLLETTLAAVPGEMLEEKIAALALPSDKDDLPAPSSDDLHWWDKLELDKGSLVISPPLLEAATVNPFDSPGDSPLSSCPSSDEELYSHAADLPIPITPEPVMRRNTDVPEPGR